MPPGDGEKNQLIKVKCVPTGHSPVDHPWQGRNRCGARRRQRAVLPVTVPVAVPDLGTGVPATWVIGRIWDICLLPWVGDRAELGWSRDTGSSGGARCQPGAHRSPLQEGHPQELRQHQQGRIRSWLCPEGTAAARHTGTGNTGSRAHIPRAHIPSGEGTLLSRLGCCGEGDGQREVLTQQLAGLRVPPALPSINGATQLRN